MKTRIITEKEFFDRPLFDKATYDRIKAASRQLVQRVIAGYKSGKHVKGVKLTPQEWIEVSRAVGGFRPQPPPQPFLVPQRRRKGTALQQMEFAFDGPQAVPGAPKKRRKVSPASARKKNSDGGAA